MAIGPQFAQASYFSEGRAAAQPEPDGVWGYSDPTGALVIEPLYQDPRPSVSGLAYVMDGFDRIYIDAAGTVVWQPVE